jgi:hypothetical protein
LGLLAAFGAQAAPIKQIDYSSLSGTQLITFDDILGGDFPGTNYDGNLILGGASFAERFAGQTNKPVGDFDVLSGTPSGPTLTLAGGELAKNLAVLVELGSQVLVGLGPEGFESFEASGEGSFAVLFETNQSQIGFRLLGGNGGSATIEFFGRDGSLIQQIVVTGLAADAFYGFAREGGVQDIAGFSIFNNDLAGIGFDDLKFGVGSTPGPPPNVSEPSSLALLVSGVCLAMAYRRRRGST